MPKSHPESGQPVRDGDSSSQEHELRRRSRHRAIGQLPLAAEEAGDPASPGRSEELSLTLRLSITWPDPKTEARVVVEVTISESSSLDAADPSVVAQAIAACIAKAVLAPFGKFKDRWLDYDTWNVGDLAKALDDAEELLRKQLLEEPTMRLLTDVSGMPPSSAELMAQVVAHWPLTADGLIDDSIRSLRLTSLIINLVAGPEFPVAVLLDLANSSLEHKLEKYIISALAPRAGREETNGGQERAIIEQLTPEDQRDAGDRDEFDLDEPPSITAGRSEASNVVHLVAERPPSITAGSDGSELPNQVPGGQTNRTRKSSRGG